MDWALRNAKDNLSKLVRLARTEGPQTITLRGQRTAVVLSVEDYDALCLRKPTTVDHLLSGPAWDDDLVAVINSRAKGPSRDPEF